jgi:hypothetical protein
VNLPSDAPLECSDEMGMAYSTPAEMKNISEFPDQFSDSLLLKKDHNQ